MKCNCGYNNKDMDLMYVCDVCGNSAHAEEGLERMIKRYSEVGVESHGNVWAVMEENEDGEYVKYKDVEEILNPWKDASKELPDYEKPVFCKSKKHDGYFSCIRHKSFLELTSVDPSSRDLRDASHWMYIPEVINE